jgi:hypothetical protein
MLVITQVTTTVIPPTVKKAGNQNLSYQTTFLSLRTQLIIFYKQSVQTDICTNEK